MKIPMLQDRRMGSLEGKVAFITGAARGQGRSHAIRLAEEGADIIAVDICCQIDSVPYVLSTPDDLAETVQEVEKRGRRIFAQQADVRDEGGLCQALEAGMDALGSVDIVLANAGIAPMSTKQADSVWRDVLDINLTGVFHTIEAAIPAMMEGGRGGAIIITGSTAAITGIGGPDRASLAYGAAKHGLVGLMKSYANNLAHHSIRVNAVHPTGVETPMVQNDAMQAYLVHKSAARAEFLTNALPVELLLPVDISNAIVWLVSDDARYVTGVSLPVDAGFSNKR
jgi:SDR family mycofactocin-dependent oxidoreductase